VSDAGLDLAAYRPRARLRSQTHEIEHPSSLVIDAHNHLGSAFGGEWASRGSADLLPILDEAGVEAIVDLDGGQGPTLVAEIDRWQRPAPDRVTVFAGLAYDRWSTDPGFGTYEARTLEASAAAGARGLKVWKSLGLRARDPAGRLVSPDDGRLDPLWQAAGRLGMPVVIHVADPIAFFEPLDGENERWEELRANPDWHFWPTRPADQPDATGFPPFDDLLATLRRLLQRHPETTFIGAHVGCAAEDLAWVAATLDLCPNFHVDIAARLGELGRQPYTSRAFFERYADRILFGVDVGPDPRVYRTYYRFLETRDESFDYDVEDVPGQGRWQIHGIGLEDAILRKVYRENARRLIFDR
jgi:predicted TIM-barrel fold metal-dependent hydrolase